MDHYRRIYKNRNYPKMLQFIRKFTRANFSNRKNFKGHQKTWITKTYKKLRRLRNLPFVEAAPGAIEHAKRIGLVTTKKGYFLPQAPEGARTRLLNYGVIAIYYGKRTDYIFNFTPTEKRRFLKEPQKTILKMIAERKTVVNANRKSERHAVALQMGFGYGSHTDYEDLDAMDYYIEKARQSKMTWLQSITGIRIKTWRK